MAILVIQDYVKGIYPFSIESTMPQYNNETSIFT